MSASLRQHPVLQFLQALASVGHGHVTLPGFCWAVQMGDLMQVEKYKRRLELLREGRLVEAMAIQTGGSSATAKAVEGMQDGAGDHLPPFISYQSHVPASLAWNSLPHTNILSGDVL